MFSTSMFSACLSENNGARGQCIGILVFMNLSVESHKNFFIYGRRTKVLLKTERKDSENGYEE